MTCVSSPIISRHRPLPHAIRHIHLQHLTHRRPYPPQQSNLQIVPMSAKGCRQQGRAQLDRRWRSMSMIWLLTQILLPPLIQLRKRQDNSRLESHSGISYTDCTHSSSRVKASLPKCGHGADSTPSSPTSTSAFTTGSLCHFNDPLRSSAFGPDLLELLIAAFHKREGDSDQLAHFAV
jgi:hypothetical protein